MTTEGLKQYRPISILETGAQNPLTVRYYRDMISNIINFKGHVCNHKVIQENWSEGNEMESWTSALGIGDTPDWDEELIRMVYAPRYVPDGYTRFIVHSMHLRTIGTGSTTWRLYFLKQFNDMRDENLRYGTWGTLNTNQWVVYEPTHHPEARKVEWITNSNTMSLSVEIAKQTIRDRRTQMQFVLTSQNDEQHMKSNLYSLDVTPILGE